jgi:predicted tellurium resistance membrane protein TerC
MKKFPFIAVGCFTIIYWVAYFLYLRTHNELGWVFFAYTATQPVSLVTAFLGEMARSFGGTVLRDRVFDGATFLFGCVWYYFLAFAIQKLWGAFRKRSQDSTTTGLPGDRNH